MGDLVSSMLDRLVKILLVAVHIKAYVKRVSILIFATYLNRYVTVFYDVMAN